MTTKAGVWIDHHKAVVVLMKDGGEVLILGPGEAKGEFEKRLKSKKLPAHNVELESADKLTDEQIAARIRQYFAR